MPHRGARVGGGMVESHPAPPATAGSRPVPQGKDGFAHHPFSAEHVGDRDGRHRRGRQSCVHGLVVQVMPGFFLRSPVETDDLDVPEPREPHGEIGHAEAAQSGRAHRGNQQIGRAQQDVEPGPVGRILQVEDGHFLACGQLRVPARRHCLQRVSGGRFDFGDTRPLVAKARSGQGAGEVDGECHDVDAVEGVAHSILFREALYECIAQYSTV
ncbi:hypothetical protein A9X06_35175 [Mycobacterium sp. 852002-51759_SCH5129042]|nr:hypothetical protein A5748_08875 [Nocardia sp. 852002-51244_SCH5132740]OBF68017.1 hypothetical protein A9X06_35175 [Mycobacterium sp. 852002-51759_SCH5129042]